MSPCLALMGYDATREVPEDEPTRPRTLRKRRRYARDPEPLCASCLGFGRTVNGLGDTVVCSDCDGEERP